MKQVVGRPLEHGLGLERRVERLDDALRAVQAALDDPGDARVLVREVAVRQVDAGDLEERDVLRAELDVAARGLDEARQQPRPKRRELDRDRLGELPRLRIGIVGPQRRRVRLGEPEAGERVLDAPAEPLDRRERAEHLPPRRKRERDVLEPEPRDLLDDVDLARDVPRAPGRRDDLAVATLEPEPLEQRVCSSGGVSMPITSSARSGR